MIKYTLDLDIKNSIGAIISDGEGSLSLFENWLKLIGYPFVQRDMDFLRGLQSLRSKGSAHMKGSSYQKEAFKRFGLPPGTELGEKLLELGAEFLHELEAWTFS